MLTDLLKLCNEISIPENFIKKHAPKFYEHIQNNITPKTELLLEKDQENLLELIKIIESEMKNSLYDSITSELKEKASIDGIKRQFEINGQIPNNTLFEKTIDKLILVNPLNIMKKGYSLIYKDDKLITSSKNLNKNDVLLFLIIFK